ncbi:MAG: hypothetical protein GY756_24405 [bacterium]|nr:hypothetical protein [bacterium]
MKKILLTILLLFSIVFCLLGNNNYFNLSNSIFYKYNNHDMYIYHFIEKTGENIGISTEVLQLTLKTHKEYMQSKGSFIHLNYGTITTGKQEKLPLFASNKTTLLYLYFNLGLKPVCLILTRTVNGAFTVKPINISKLSSTLQYKLNINYNPIWTKPHGTIWNYTVNDNDIDGTSTLKEQKYNISISIANLIKQYKSNNCKFNIMNIILTKKINDKFI